MFSISSPTQLVATAAPSSSSSISGALYSSFSSVSAAASMAANAAASIKLPTPSLGYGGRKDQGMTSEYIAEVVQELGLNGPFVGEKIEIEQKYAALTQTDGLLPLENFVIDMKSRGFNVQWADASFRAFDFGRKNSLAANEYLLAIMALRMDDRLLDNRKWLELRRRLVFCFYDRGGKGCMSLEDFVEFGQDCDRSTGRPEVFGLHNNTWQKCCNDSVSPQTVSYEHMSQALAISKVELASKQSEFEELQFLYLQLEKKMCALKLDLAAARAMAER